MTRYLIDTDVMVDISRRIVAPLYPVQADLDAQASYPFAVASVAGRSYEKLEF